MRKIETEKASPHRKTDSLAMRIVALLCYGWLASQSGFFLWMLYRIKSSGFLTAVEPNAIVINSEIAITGLVTLVAIVMFVRQRLFL